jgi:hypothetical protein
MGVYSHNIVTVFIIFYLAITMNSRGHDYLVGFLLSCVCHYLFDVFEDYICFKRINSNWFLKFSKKQKDLVEF